MALGGAVRALLQAELGDGGLQLGGQRDGHDRRSLREENREGEKKIIKSCLINDQIPNSNFFQNTQLMLQVKDNRLKRMDEKKVFFFFLYEITLSMLK